jgi:hypothetical protein
MSILETLAKSITPEQVSQISKQLGVNEDVAQKGVEIGIPLLIAALNRNAQSSEGAESLTNALKRDHDGSILQRPEEVINNYQQSDGNGILKHVLGDQREQVESAVGKSAGIDGGALLQILAPLVMGALGAHQRSGNLDSDGVAGVLKGTTEQIEQQGDNQVMRMITTLLDSNRDGSILDEVLGMLGRFFSSERK